MLFSVCLSACGKKNSENSSTEKATTESATKEDVSSEAPTDAPTEPAADTENFVEIALNVMYNDADKNYTGTEHGDSIKVTDNGQYTLSFDCATQLSDEAKAAGVDSLTNLTAIYIIDMGTVVSGGTQSTISACNIKYDKIEVDGTELTITKTEPKSALKSSGIFDTNDPINGWDGSAVEETVQDTANHIANFSNPANPKSISVTFTLSDIKWGEDESGNGSDKPADSTNTYVNSQKYSDIDFTDMNSVELVKLLGNGINLGNTMEAFDTGKGKGLDVSQYEQCWGQPITTKEMIVGMKNCGFDTLRIPVAWTNMMDWENGDFTINTALLDRVAEITQWALDAEMFVIINDHYDHGWYSMFGSSDKDTVDTAWKIYESIWTQVSDRFKDFSDMVIFESANEELGQFLNDTSTCSTSGHLSDAEIYTTITAINQKFVDIVRASGGNNDDRFLLIAGNNTNIDKTISNSYVMPTDTVDGKLLISVHYYDPWNYCCDKDHSSPDDLTGYKWGLKDEYDYMYKQLAKMNKFTDAGYGVIIGEYGALPAWINGESYEIPYTLEYTNSLLNVCDINNLCPVLWSTNNSYNKNTLNMISDEQLKLYTSRCYQEEAAKGDSYLADVQADMDKLLADAPDTWPGQEVYEPGTSVAWIMWNGGAGTYSVGDAFNSADCTAGITATNTVVEGAGEYTISLDFAGGNTGLTFAAIGIADCEINFPGAIIDIKEITYDGSAITPVGDYYTSSDDKKCTRVNLYNQWVNKLPDDARTASGDLSNATPTPLDPTQISNIKNITIKFEVIIPE